MTNEPTNARKAFGDIAPDLAEITDKILFGDVWADPALSPRGSQPDHHQQPDLALSDQRAAVPS